MDGAHTGRKQVCEIEEGDIARRKRGKSRGTPWCSNLFSLRAYRLIDTTPPAGAGAMATGGGGGDLGVGVTGGLPLLGGGGGARAAKA